MALFFEPTIAIRKSPLERVGNAGAREVAEEVLARAPTAVKAIAMLYYALPSVMLKLVIEKACPEAKTVLSTVISPPPPVAVTVPCA